MVVICPKCKVRLKIVDEKLSTEGTKFKCPKCATVLLVKKPAPQGKILDKGKILVAVEEQDLAERIKRLLGPKGYTVVTAHDGIEAMVKSSKELPFLSLFGVSLPKIHGFEVCRRLKSRPETKAMKVILIANLYDKKRFHRDPQSFYEADGYLEDNQIEDMLISKIESLKGVAREEPTTTGLSTGTSPPSHSTVIEKKTLDAKSAGEKAGDAKEPTEKAKRLARTIISDIYLYSRAKVEEAIKSGSFHETFASELKEGVRLYEMRIPSEVKALGDFFNDAVNNFIENKKREIS